MALTDEQRESVYRLVRKQPKFKPFFDYLADLKHNMKESSLNVVETQSGLNKQGSLELMREIAATGVASVGGGGGGVSSYLVWADGIDIRDVGRSSREPLR
ncbi:MAG: hypothetical protein JSS00_12215 [Proteobacteria bacterium]|nr:hypothetical protein [Pseudomonadota bacterium]